MGSGGKLYDALLPDENQYLAESPFYLSGVNVMRQPTLAPQNNTQALLMPILQGLGGGIMMGYGKGQANEAASEDFGRLGQMIMGPEFEAPSEDVTASNARSMLANLIMKRQLDSETQSEQIKSQSDLSKVLLGQGLMIDPTNPGQIIGVPGLAEAKANQAGMIKKSESDATNREEKITKSKDAAIAAQSGIESLDRLKNMAENLPSTMVGRWAESHSPFTNETNFYDDQTTATAAAIAKQLEGRVNETVLRSYQDSISRHPGDSKQDVKNRLVNAQLWLARIAQGDTKALDMDAAQFAKDRGVDPKTLGIQDFGGTPNEGIYKDAPQGGGLKYKASDLLAQGYTKGPNGWVKP